MHDATKHGCDQHNSVNRIEIRLNILSHFSPAADLSLNTPFISTLFISTHHLYRHHLYLHYNTPVYNVASKVTRTMISELIAHASEELIELIVHIPVVF